MSKKKSWLERLTGSAAREIVRLSFTLFGIFAFYQWGEQGITTAQAKCEGLLTKIGLTANQAMAVAIFLVAGYGSALVMKFVESRLPPKPPVGGS
jgi:hypothetical protein